MEDKEGEEKQEAQEARKTTEMCNEEEDREGKGPGKPGGSQVIDNLLVINFCIALYKKIQLKG